MKIRFFLFGLLFSWLLYAQDGLSVQQYVDFNSITNVQANTSGNLMAFLHGDREVVLYSKAMDMIIARRSLADPVDALCFLSRDLVALDQSGNVSFLKLPTLELRSSYSVEPIAGAVGRLKMVPQDRRLYIQNPQLGEWDNPWLSWLELDYQGFREVNKDSLIEEHSELEGYELLCLMPNRFNQEWYLVGAGNEFWVADRQGALRQYSVPQSFFDLFPYDLDKVGGYEPVVYPFWDLYQSTQRVALINPFYSDLGTDKLLCSFSFPEDGTELELQQVSSLQGVMGAWTASDWDRSFPAGFGSGGISPILADMLHELGISTPSVGHQDTQNIFARGEQNPLEALNLENRFDVSYGIGGFEDYIYSANGMYFSVNAQGERQPVSGRLQEFVFDKAKTGRIVELSELDIAIQEEEGLLTASLNTEFGLRSVAVPLDNLQISGSSIQYFDEESWIAGSVYFYWDNRHLFGEIFTYYDDMGFMDDHGVVLYRDDGQVFRSDHSSLWLHPDSTTTLVTLFEYLPESEYEQNYFHRRAVPDAVIIGSFDPDFTEMRLSGGPYIFNQDYSLMALPDGNKFTVLRFDSYPEDHQEEVLTQISTLSLSSAIQKIIFLSGELSDKIAILTEDNHYHVYTCHTPEVTLLFSVDLDEVGQVQNAPRMLHIDGYGSITGNQLRVRREPTLEGEVVGSLDAEDRVFIIRETEETMEYRDLNAPWYQILAPWGEFAWAYGGYINREAQQ